MLPYEMYYLNNFDIQNTKYARSIKSLYNITRKHIQEKFVINTTFFLYKNNVIFEYISRVMPFSLPQYLISSTGKLNLLSKTFIHFI